MSEVISENYRAIRRRAEAMNNRIPADHPCVRGNGECCRQRNISLTLEDARLIVEAVGSGKISRSVRQQAIRNASDPTREYCPFFDTERRVCNIYKYRPIICIAHGVGGIPWANEVTVDVPVNEMAAINMCHGCFNHLNGSTKTVPLQDVQDYQVIERHVKQQERIGINEFARRILPGRTRF